MIYDGAGTFINNIMIDAGRPMQIEFVQGNMLVYIDNSDGQAEHSFLLINPNADIIKRYYNKYNFEMSGPIVAVADVPVRYHYNNTLFVKEAYSDTIFFFDEYEFVTRYIFNQGEGKLTTDVFGMDLITEGHKYISFRRIFETSQFLFVTYWWNKQGLTMIKCKDGGKIAIFDNEIGLINDIDGGIGFIPEKAITKGGTEYLLTWLDSHKFKAYVESEAFRNSTPKYPEKKKELEKLAANLNENDNPVLMLVTIKE